jgi:hypothetical protein
LIIAWRFLSAPLELQEEDRPDAVLALGDQIADGLRVDGDRHGLAAATIDDGRHFAVFPQPPGRVLTLLFAAGNR